LENAILVGTHSLDELRELATSAGARIIDEVIQRRDRPDPATFIGKGKVEELRDQVVLEGVDVAIFDDELSPSQAKNLEEALDIKVVDRTGLILDIFGRRARTREGKLQVELAQLEYRLTRLAGYREYLSRLGGGIGTRGPGETKLEMDRRQIRRRIGTLKKDIEQIRKHRRLHRDRRRRDGLPLVSLVGYTNAGKSTLFCALSKENTLVSRRLFSTLDTLIRRIQIGQNVPILISDTVGFIRKLPHQLVSAFRATLEEVVEADLILHVIDVSDPEFDKKREVVLNVLEEIGAGKHPMLTVFNKMDLVPELRPSYDALSARPPSPNGRGCEARARQGEASIREARARQGEASINAERLDSDGIYVSAVSGEGLHDLVNEIIHQVSLVRV
jgi:GTP-binding protein HflX